MYKAYVLLCDWELFHVKCAHFCSEVLSTLLPLSPALCLFWSGLLPPHNLVIGNSLSLVVGSAFCCQGFAIHWHCLFPCVTLHSSDKGDHLVSDLLSMTTDLSLVRYLAP